MRAGCRIGSLQPQREQGAGTGHFVSGQLAGLRVR